MASLNSLVRFFTENRTVTQTVTKNTFWLFVGQLTSRSLRAIIIVVAARALGASSWGAFSYALSIVTFLTIFGDFGMNALLTKEVIRQPKERSRYLGTALVIKIVIGTAIAVSVILLRHLITNIDAAADLLPILIFVFTFDILRDLGTALVRSLERMEVEAGLTTLTNALIVGGGLIALWGFGSAASLALAYTVGSGAGLMATIYTLRHHLPGLISGATTKLIRPILTTAWPFGLLGLLGTISLNTDIIMIGWFKAAASVGYYSTAQKPIQLLYALPAIIGGGLFPALARFAALGDGVRLRALVERALGTVLAIATPLAILGLLLGDYAIELVFGPEYRPAATSFRILALTLPIVYPATILGNTLFALNAERKFTAYVLVGVVSNFLGNLLLIPRYGIAGAAIATIIAQLLSNLLFWTTMKKLLPTSLRRYAPPVALSGLIMALSIFILILLDTPPIFAALLGGAAYAATFTLLGGTQLFASFFKNSDMETLEVAS